MDVVSGKEHTHHNPTPPRSTEPNCRLQLENNDRPYRLAVEPCHIQSNQSIESGPFYLQNHWTDLYATATDAFLQDWSLWKGYAISPWCSISSPDPMSTTGANSPSEEVSTLVPSCSEDGNKSPPVDLGRQSQGHRSQKRDADASISRMAHLRDRYRSQDLSQEATTLMFKSWRSKTNKFYDSLFGR